MDPLPLHPYGRWAMDLRGEGRAVRVSAHAQAGFLILSTWKADECVGTVRLVPDEATELMAGIAEGLADLANDHVQRAAHSDPQPPPHLEARLQGLERRLAELEWQARRG
ncbi:MAG: hypothetical protein ACR2KO_11175 [Geodermatophilaceae bacterium]